MAVIVIVIVIVIASTVTGLELVGVHPVAQLPLHPLGRGHGVQPLRRAQEGAALRPRHVPGVRPGMALSLIIIIRRYTSIPCLPYFPSHVLIFTLGPLGLNTLSPIR